MNRTVFITLIMVFAVFSGSPAQGQNPLRTDGTAHTVPAKLLELSLFRPSKYGITNKDELSLHPIGMFALPHVFYKRAWLKFDLFQRHFLFSSRHGLYYPQFALNINQKHLPFDFLKYEPEQAKAPSALAFQSEVLLSHYLHEPNHCSAGNYLITARMGFKYAARFNERDTVLIYRSILYRETAVLQPGLVWYVGGQLDGQINYTFNYFADLDFYSYGFIKDYAIEAKAGIYGYMGSHWSGFLGFKTGFSTIPDRNRFMILPVGGFSYFIDLKKRRKHGTDLFGRKKPFKHDNSLERDDKYYENLEKRKQLTDSIQ